MTTLSGMVGGFFSSPLGRHRNPIARVRPRTGQSARARKPGRHSSWVEASSQLALLGIPSRGLSEVCEAFGDTESVLQEWAESVWALLSEEAKAAFTQTARELRLPADWTVAVLRAVLPEAPMALRDLVTVTVHRLTERPAQDPELLYGRFLFLGDSSQPLHAALLDDAVSLGFERVTTAQVSEWLRHPEGTPLASKRSLVVECLSIADMFWLPLLAQLLPPLLESRGYRVASLRLHPEETSYEFECKFPNLVAIGRDHTFDAAEESHYLRPLLRRGFVELLKQESAQRSVKFEELPTSVQQDIAEILVDQVPALSDWNPHELRRTIADALPTTVLTLGEQKTAKLRAQFTSRRTSPEAVSVLQQKLSPGAELDPVVVARGRFVDGGHRVQAYVNAGRPTIPVVDIAELLARDWPRWLDGKDESTSFDTKSEPVTEAVKSVTKLLGTHLVVSYGKVGFFDLFAAREYETMRPGSAYLDHAARDPETAAEVAKTQKLLSRIWSPSEMGRLDQTELSNLANLNADAVLVAKAARYASQKLTQLGLRAQRVTLLVRDLTPSERTNQNTGTSGTAGFWDARAHAIVMDRTAVREASAKGLVEYLAHEWAHATYTQLPKAVKLAWQSFYSARVLRGLEKLPKTAAFAAITPAEAKSIAELILTEHPRTKTDIAYAQEHIEELKFRATHPPRPESPFDSLHAWEPHWITDFVRNGGVIFGKLSEPQWFYPRVYGDDQAKRLRAGTPVILRLYQDGDNERRSLAHSPGTPMIVCVTEDRAWIRESGDIQPDRVRTKRAPENRSVRLSQSWTDYSVDSNITSVDRVFDGAADEMGSLGIAGQLLRPPKDYTSRFLSEVQRILGSEARALGWLEVYHDQFYRGLSPTVDFLKELRARVEAAPPRKLALRKEIVDCIALVLPKEILRKNPGLSPLQGERFAQDREQAALIGLSPSNYGASNHLELWAETAAYLALEKPVAPALRKAFLAALSGDAVRAESMDESTFHPTNSLGIARKDMPQIRSKVIPKFVHYLRGMGVSIKTALFTVNRLRPTQSEIDVDRARERGSVGDTSAERPIIVSADGYVLDGHHRWFSEFERNPTAKIVARVVSLPIRELLAAAKKFSGVEYAPAESKPSPAQLIEGLVYAIEEGLFDRYTLKAVFMAGSGGSGKSTFARQAFGGSGLMVLNTDEAYEYLLRKHGVPMSQAGANSSQPLRAQAKELVAKQTEYAFKERRGVLIDGTGDKPEKILKLKKKLDELGYDSGMVCVHVPLKLALSNNEKRAERGGRKVPEEVIRDSWEAVESSLPKYQEAFGKNFQLAHRETNDAGFDPKVVKGASAFLRAPITNPKGLEWLEQETQGKEDLRRLAGLAPKKKPAGKADKPDRKQLSPDEYHRQHGECPNGYHWDAQKNHCVLAGGPA